MGVIILLLIIAAALVAEQKIYERHWADGIRVNIGFGADSAVEGGKTELVEVIEHNGTLPLPWLNVKFQASRELILPDAENARVTDYYYREDVFAIRPGERVTRRLPVECVRRGVQKIRSIDVITRDILMSEPLVANFDGSASVVVYPKPVDVSDITCEARQLMGEYIVKRRTNEDPFVFRGLRDYVEGDPVRSINQRAGAKRDKLTVNQYESTTSLCASIWLDCDSGAGGTDEQLVEEGIRVAASLASELIIGGVPVSLFTNGCDYLTGSETGFIKGGCSTQHIDSISTALACLDLSKETRPLSAALDDIADSMTEEVVIIITTDTRTALRNRLEAMREDGREVVRVILAREDDMSVGTLCDMANTYVRRVRM